MGSSDDILLDLIRYFVVVGITRVIVWVVVMIFGLILIDILWLQESQE